MQAFQWRDCFATGLAEIDAQHRQLIDVINRFGALVIRDETASAAELEGVFDELAHYARFHFAQEEALMATSGLNLQYVENHRQKHRQFMTEVSDLYQGITIDNRGAAKGLLAFLTNWLAYHILGTDQYMARQLAQLASGDPTQDTQHADKRSQDPAKDALLSALNNLFQQVSERNHELVQLNKTLEARVVERTQALTDANQRLDDLANTDLLTHLPNRRHAMRSLHQAWAEALKSHTALTCMMVDADGFKQINDIHGHDAGDGVLSALARQLCNSVRTDDLVCRLGGDEFLVICVNTPMAGGLLLAEKIRADVAALRVSAGTGEWRGSVSVGVAVRAAHMTRMEDLLKAADLAVYAAKRNGRNCVAFQ